MLVMFIFLSPTGRARASWNVRVPFEQRQPIYAAIQASALASAQALAEPDVQAKTKNSAQARGIRYKVCDPFLPEEFKLFIDACGRVYKHAGEGVQADLGHLIEDPACNCWGLLSDEEQHKHWVSFSDLLPLLAAPPPAKTLASPGMVFIPAGIF
jgi:hypothetical protein